MPPTPSPSHSPEFKWDDGPTVPPTPAPTTPPVEATPTPVDPRAGPTAPPTPAPSISPEYPQATPTPVDGATPTPVETPAPPGTSPTDCTTQVGQLEQQIIQLEKDVEILQLKLQIKTSELSSANTALDAAQSSGATATTDLIARTAERDTYKDLLEKCQSQLVSKSEETGNAEGSLNAYMGTVTQSVCDSVPVDPPTPTPVTPAPVDTPTDNGFPACVMTDMSLGGGPMKLVGGGTAQTCSNKCSQQPEADCVTWTFDSDSGNNKRCYLYAEYAAVPTIVKNSHSGARSCLQN